MLSGCAQSNLFEGENACHMAFFKWIQRLIWQLFAGLGVKDSQPRHAQCYLFPAETASVLVMEQKC